MHMSSANAAEHANLKGSIRNRKEAGTIIIIINS